MTCKKLVPEELPWLFIFCGNSTVHLLSILWTVYFYFRNHWERIRVQKKYANNAKINPVFNHITPEILNFKQLLKYDAVACLYWERFWGWKVSPRECDVSNENKPIGPCLRIFVPHLIGLLGKLWPCNKRFFSGSEFWGYNSQVVSQITLSSQSTYL